MCALLLAAMVMAGGLAGCVTTPAAHDAPADDPLSGVPLGPFPAGTLIGDTRLFTRVGGPGSPEGIALDSDCMVVGSAEPERSGAVFRTT